MSKHPKSTAKQDTSPDLTRLTRSEIDALREDARQMDAKFRAIHAAPTGTPQLGEVHPVRRPLLSANQNYTPAALSPLRRQNPLCAFASLVANASHAKDYQRDAAEIQ
jgi:hypothetical protein